MILVPLFDLKFVVEFAAGGCGNFKSAALACVACGRRARTELAELKD